MPDSNGISLQQPLRYDFKPISRLKDAKELIETEPRAIVTAVFLVSNPTDQRREFVSEVSLPDGWMLITKDFEFELSPNQTDTRLISFFVPQTALAGVYEITCVIKDRKNPAIRDFYTASVKVLPESRLQVKLLESPNFVIAGEKYQSSFVVTNQGNTEYTINTKIDSKENMPYTANVEKFTLAPGQSKTVIVNVKTSEKTAKRLKHQLRLTAEAVEDGKTKAKAKSASSVEIIPRISGTGDNFHRIPTEVILRYVSEKNQDNRSGFQTEVRGQGTLDEEGKKHIEFSFRGPDVQDKSIFGERDEYYLSYWRDEYELHLGDRSYCLSPLTENYLYGRGLEGRLKINDDLNVGAYHMETRWRQPSIHETAAYMDYLINDKFKVGANYLRKLRDGKLSDIVSFEAQLEPFRDTRVELEYAIGPGGTGKDNAYLTWLYGNNNYFSYYLKLTHAGPEYPGYYSDLDYISAGVTVPINKYLRLNASFRQQENNVDLDPLFYSAPLEKYYQFGVDYRLQTDTTLSFDWLNRSRKDRLDSPQFDYRENAFRFGIGQSFKKLTVRTSVELGQTDNQLDNTTSDLERYTASVYFRPDSRQTYSGYFYYDKDSDFSGENIRSTTIGVNANYQLADRTFFNLSLRTNDYQDSPYGDRDNLELRLSHIFANDNRISVFARHTRYKDSSLNDDTALMVEYTIPLGLPVCKKKSVGSIKGYIYNEQTQNPIGNVILRLNGLTAVSDKSGNFAFPTVAPGIHYLNVDTASIGMDQVPNRKIPIELTIQGGEKTQVDIPITKAARLLGQVIVYGYKSNHDSTDQEGKSSSIEPFVVGDGRNNEKDGQLGEVHGLADAIVELKDSSEIKRTVTDKQGEFSFTELRPGEWILKICSDNLPEYHCLDKDTFQLELKPGQETKVSAKVLPKKRQIKIIDQPQTLLEEVQK